MMNNEYDYMITVHIRYILHVILPNFHLIEFFRNVPTGSNMTQKRENLRNLEI